MSGSTIYVLQVQNKGVRAWVTLNGARVFDETTGAAKTFQTKVNPYIIEGPNRLTVYLAPRPPDASPVGPNPPAFELALVVGEVGVVPGPEGVLLAWRWSPGAPALEDDVWTPVLDRAFTPRDTFGRWLWQDAPAGAITDDDRGAIVALVRAAHDALVNRDADALVALQRVRNEELGRALDVPPADIARGQREFYREFFASPDWRPDAFDPDALTFTPHAEGRLVSVSDAADEPPVRGAAGDEVLALPVTVSCVDGDWVIVR